MTQTIRINYSATPSGVPLTDMMVRAYRNLPNGMVQASFMEGNTPIHVAANTAAGGVLVKSGAGTIVAVMINTKGSTSNTLTLYDGTTTAGTVLAILDTTASLTYLPYNMSYQTGFLYTLLAGTAADLTIMYL